MRPHRAPQCAWHDLSEIAFSRLPLDTVLPGLAASSPLRALFRTPVHLPFALYAM